MYPLSTIMLIDDSLDELRLLSDMLRHEHFRLMVATDGRQGYQRAIVAQPDLIVMDVAMPQMDGFTACRLLKTDPVTCHIPVIFLSAKNSAEERLQGLSIGGEDYISKPFLEAEVLMRIRIHLNRLRGCLSQPDAERAIKQLSPDEIIARAAANLIQDQLEALPTVAKIAHMVGTHEKKLGRIFHNQFGMTVSTFIREERISVACKLLTGTEMSVRKIAAQVGFENAGNFATAFRERMGMPPSDYREATRHFENEPLT
ncbi:response regulator [Candidatus Methylospira mobilis]|uniref:Response regulator n=1 Tax=Candidatus Methylospira mobilis TaxID=1808979 RepID=A0A5Q0BBV1_9GAMM|nr:response regulator [Candidatus Methylospira mobilis]QFY41250.1 response regulator [Candidatus Methylospira mobilis]WNV05529.1 response regulator [Candidatus Methylospira mobilis]